MRAFYCSKRNDMLLISLKAALVLAIETSSALWTTYDLLPGCPLSASLCTGLPQTLCSCDEQCVLFGDCCPGVVPPDVPDVPDVWTCSPIAGGAFYAIGKCPEESPLGELCVRRKEYLVHLQNLPVYSRTSSVLYANVFCATCHNDTGSLLPWHAEYSCSAPGVTPWSAEDVSYDVVRGTYVIHEGHRDVQCLLRVTTSSLPSSLRSCSNSLSRCAPNWPLEDEAQRFCRLYSFPVLDGGTRTTYKNPHCAHCNHVGDHNLACDLIPDVPVQDTVVWTPLVLDFNAPEPKNSCSLYDPVLRRCHPLEPPEPPTPTPSYVCPDPEVLLDPGVAVYVDNVSLLFEGVVVRTFREVEAVNGSGVKIAVCVPAIPGGLDFVTTSSDVSSIVSYASLVSLLLHLLSYSILDHLRMLQGKALLLVSLALLLEQISMIAGKGAAARTFPCAVAAVFSHYFLLVSAFATDVLAFDVYHAFSGSQLRATKGALLLRYTAYAYLCPLMPVLAGITFDSHPWSRYLTPEYGRNDPCWLSQRGGVIAFLIAPWCAAVVLATLLLVETVRRVGSASSCEKSIQKWGDRARLRRYIWFVILSGAACTMGLLAASGPFPSLWQPFAVSLASRGIFVFVAFTCADRRLVRTVRQKLNL